VAVDRINSLYHLTPRGWVDGSVESMWTDTNHSVEPPADRVETWEHKLYQASGYSREENSWQMVWSDSTTSAEDRRSLHELFPHDQDRTL
jgi:hypothetical protein